MRSSSTAKNRNPAIWTAQDYAVLVITGTVSLCFLIVTGGIIGGVLIGKLTVEMLGTVKGISAGGGLLGLAVIISQILKSIVAKR